MSLQNDKIQAQYGNKPISLTYIDQTTNNVRVLGGVDIWISEKHALESIATHYPIEDGSSISDNVYTKPVKLTLVGYISNIDSSGRVNPQKVIDTWGELTNIQKNILPIKVVTNLEVFGISGNQDMYITKLSSSTIDIDSGTSVEFSLVLSQLTIVESKEITITSIPPEKVSGDSNPAKNSTSQVDGGTQRSKSLAAEAFDGGLLNSIGGLF